MKPYYKIILPKPFEGTAPSARYTCTCNSLLTGDSWEINGTKETIIAEAKSLQAAIIDKRGNVIEDYSNHPVTTLIF